MSRKDEFKSGSQNPAKCFMEWKSNYGCFSYYNKDKQENINVELPFKFLTLMEMHTVKGWHDASESSIYSNEVRNISKEEMHVRSFKGGTIAKGLYKDIKHMLSGGRYVKSIYIMTHDGVLMNIQLKGAAVQSWGEFVNENRSRITDEWVSVYEADQRTKGSINYTVPLFKFDQSLNDEDILIADEVYKELKSYISEYLNEKQATEQVYQDAVSDAEQIPEPAGTEDDLPF